MNSRAKLSTRLLLLYSIIFLPLLGLMAVAVDRVASAQLLEDIQENLAVAADLAFTSLPSDPAEYEAWAEEIFEIGAFRTTLIDEDGVVLADSHTDPATMENHGQREEILEAAAGEIGLARRLSVSTGFDQQYVALPPRDGLFMRTSVSTRVINDDLNALRWGIAISGLVVAGIGIVVVAVLARRMARPITELTEQAEAVAAGDPSVEPRRSTVAEIDALGVAISTMATNLRSRVSDAEQATETLDVVLSALPQGTLLIGSTDEIVYSNSSAEQLLGRIPDNLSSLAPHQLQTVVRDARDEGETVRVDLEHGVPARRLRALAMRFSDDNRVLLLVIDVTERDRADSIRRDFVANASHELKTPVATIIASAEAMQIALDRGDQSASGFAERVESSARQLDSLVSDLLDLSRLEREEPEVAKTRVDLLVRDEIERARQPAIEKGLSIDVDVEPVVANLSHRDVSIAVRNLLDNSIRYTNEGGTVGISVQAEDQLTISVSDTGVGIPTRDLERVFERFYRVDSARSRATGGTGLGLSIVKHVAESHGGSVAVSSELGVGTTVTISLPIGEDPSDN